MPSWTYKNDWEGDGGMPYPAFFENFIRLACGERGDGEMGRGEREREEKNSDQYKNDLP